MDGENEEIKDYKYFNIKKRVYINLMIINIGYICNNQQKWAEQFKFNLFLKKELRKLKNKKTKFEKEYLALIRQDLENNNLLLSI